MKICVLVKEVPDAAVEKRMDPGTMRLDRGGEKNLNPFDTHAIEAAMQIKEGGTVQVDEVVAVTMGPESAQRALHKAVSLGADRSLHLTDEALAGSDVNGTGYALAKALEAEQPDLVLLGQQSDDGECYTIGAVEVEEVVAVTMGPETAVRALHKAVSLGADRSLHLTDEALAGSDVNGTGYALAKALEAEQPDRKSVV